MIHFGGMHVPRSLYAFSAFPVWLYKISSPLLLYCHRVTAAEDALLLLGSARRCRLAVLDEDGERWQGDVTLDAERGEVNLDGGCGVVVLDAGRGNVQQAVLAVLLALRYVGSLQRVEADGQQQAAVGPHEPVSYL